ncbi:NAD(P)H-hydrate dehydratase [Thiotrichales bacterium 19S11-10]|nr:NAD(P)H-hydrate dehydratase [Thiotrichales bacterium 19S11-10]
MEFLYNTSQVYKIEKTIADKDKIPMALLMQRAGFAIFRNIPENARQTLIFIGPGNNGGDGIVTACFLKQFDKEPIVIHLTPLTNLSPLAKKMSDHAKTLGVIFKKFDLDFLKKLNVNQADTIVDALFGIGLSKAPTGNFKQAIEWINQTKAYVISADCPSGLSADNGSPFNPTVNAQLTAQFLLKKQGLYSEEAANYVGKLQFNNLGIENISTYGEGETRLLTRKYIDQQHKPRKPNSHKGMLGHIVIIGGDTGMGGAVILNALAALKSGAGKVTVLTQPEHVIALLSYLPEAMVKGVSADENISSYLDDASVITIGSGMSIELSWSNYFFNIVDKYTNNKKPRVYDAGMLHYLALKKEKKLFKNSILTPHVGEAAKLLKQTNSTISNQRFNALDNLVKTYQATVILKGKGTLIGSPQHKRSLCPLGNPYMATAGMGDLLTGMAAAYLAQGYQTQLAAELAVWQHAKKADELLSLGKVPMITSDMLE